MISSLKLKIVGFLERLTLPENIYAMAEEVFELYGRRKPLKDFSYHHKRILVIQPDLIGDVVLTSPFLRELRANYPGSWITLVVEPHTLNLVEHCPYVNEVLTYDCKKWRLYWRWKFCLSAAWLSLRHLIWRKFDLVIFPHWEIDHFYATMLAYLSGAIYRISYSEKVTVDKQNSNRNYNLLLTHALEEGVVRHEVEQKLFILKSLGCELSSDHLEIWLTRDDELFAERFLQTHRYRQTSPLIAMCLGGSHPRKRWSSDRFLEIARWLIDTCNAQILLVGDLSDRQSGRLFKELGNNLIDSTGKATIRETAALLKHCQLYIGNDTGPMHLAAAMKVPVVAISCHPIQAAASRAYSPKRFSPWKVHHKILQPALASDVCASSGQLENGLSFCDYCISDRAHCILGVAVDDVKVAVTEVFILSDQSTREKSDFVGVT